LAKAPKVLVLNGPNLNMLGLRQPEIYGSTTLAEIEANCVALGKKLGLSVRCVQSNSEGGLVDAVQKAREDCSGIVINPAGYSHTSVALLDALLAVDLPVIEVHLSNIHQRDQFRRHSYVSQAASGVLCGFGAEGYRMALEAMARRLLKVQET